MPSYLLAQIGIYVRNPNYSTVFLFLTIHRAGSFINPCNKTNEVELIFSKIARWASRAEEEMSHREMLRLIFSIKNSLSDVVPSSPSWGRSYYTHWHLGWIASPLYQLCDAMPRGIELKHWTHFLHFATRSFEATISSRSRWCSLRRAESSRWSLSLPTCLAHSLQQGRKCRRISAKKTTVNMFLSAETAVKQSTSPTCGPSYWCWYCLSTTSISAKTKSTWICTQPLLVPLLVLYASSKCQHLVSR